MTHPRSHAELLTLRKSAQELAQGRKERMTSVHLLAVVATDAGPAGELLRDRKLDIEVLLKASRSFDDEGPDPIGRLFAAAREIATRRVWYGAEASPKSGSETPSSPHPRLQPSMRGSAPGRPPEPAALHLLLALLADRSAAAHRSLVQAGVDLIRLRTAALQIALGVVAARRTPAAPARGLSTSADPAPGRASAVAISPSPASPPPTIATPVPSRRSPLRPASAALPPQAVPTTPTRLPARAPKPAPVADAAPASSARAKPKRPTSSRFALDRAAFPVLSAIGHNLTVLAADGQLAEVVGRDDEIERVLDVLAKRQGNSPCLIGPPGVGKTSIARGLAQRLVDLDLDTATPPRVLVEIVISELVAGTFARGALAEKLASLRGELAQAGGRVVLFIDEIHDLFDSGSLEEAVAEFKLGLARGDLKIVGATSLEGYRKTIESDGALARRFAPIEIEEPVAADAFLLLRSVAEGLGKHHGITYSDEALATAVSWSQRYIPGRALPDKAIGILDLARARASRRVAQGSTTPVVLGPEAIAPIVAEIADVPVERLLETDRDRMLGLEKLLAERVVGHDAALARIARVLRRNAAGLRDRRPIGSFLLLGPTGVGKTETAKAIAHALFHSEDAMTRLDFSEYAEAHAVARLIGAPPGYIGHEAGGQLTEAVRKRPYQVILLDEIEKAHRDVLEAFLQVFDEGRLTDGRGRRVDFTNTVLVMTSNLGASEATVARTGGSIGFASAAKPRTGDTDRVSDAVTAAARAYLPPELYNRIDEVLCMRALTRSDVTEIAHRLLGSLGETLARRGLVLEVADGVVDALLAAGGFDPELGARPLKRTIGRLIENPLAELILRGDLEEGSVVLVELEGGEVVVDAVTDRRAMAQS